MPVLDDAPSVKASRADIARAVLRRAEERAGVPRAARHAPPRHRLEPPLPAAPAAPAAPEELPDERLLPVHADLAPLLPLGGLQRGTALAVHGSTGLLLALLAQASRTGAWTAVVGFPGVGLLAAGDAGMDLGRVALVPRPGPDAAATVAALVDGMDVVVVGPEAVLQDADRRRLLARARERGALVVSAAPWPGAHVVLTARAGTWSGLDHGGGWLRRRTLVVERAGRAGASRPVRVELELPVDRTGWPAFLTEPGAAPAPRTAAVPDVPDVPAVPAVPDVPAVPEPPDLRLVG